MPAASAPAFAPHAAPAEEVLRRLDSGLRGLSPGEAEARRRRVGPNELPRGRPPGVARLFVAQFLSPLIYVLCAAAALSLAIGHATDALFIAGVLLANAIIGTAQEHAAHRSAEALRALVATRARVVRDGVDLEVDAAGLVPGDLVRLEAGFRVPADARLVSATSLETDESLLTGESTPVAKRAEPPVPVDAPVADRASAVFAGTLVSRGRADAVVVATGLATEVGRIAGAVARAPPARPPLLVRMDRFSRRVAAATGLAVALLAAVSLARGAPMEEVFLTAVALAVSAIPEGLPVALTVALAVGARRMARRRVIARRLVAVEALGSCTWIGSDKTGTLTLNELTARVVQLPGEAPWAVSGGGTAPEGRVVALDGSPEATARLRALCAAAALCNDARLARRDGAFTGQGDAVDVALLVLAEKAGVSRAEAEARRPRVGELPFEAERRFAATLHAGPDGPAVYVKGAIERVLAMCDRAAGPAGEEPLDAGALSRDAEALAAQGFRVLAVAAGRPAAARELDPRDLARLVFLGVVGMIDPLRPGAAESVRACRAAGIEVAMVTGDHPVTALAIARELGLAEDPREVVTGAHLAEAAARGEAALDARVRGARVFARADPSQKLDVVHAARRAGHFVAVTGDGANDAPALRAAHIGVAMGRRGTDVARESADLVLADDDFSSIAAGVEEGRVAYGNVRKVIFLLVSTGAAEIVLFLLAIAAGSPLPLLPVQLLWLNLVTNGVQDVALAFEPAEGGEMRRPPRTSREPVFDRVMLSRCALSAGIMGALGFAAFAAALRGGMEVEAARSGLLLAMVLFENVQAGNARSETVPVLRLDPRRNPLLLGSALVALGLHVASMHLPLMADALRLRPAGLAEWGAALAGALLLAGAVDVEKALRARAAGGGRPRGTPPATPDAAAR